MRKILEFYSTTVGKKVVAAVTGIILFLFLIAHMGGNLRAFAGKAASGEHKLDIYARHLREIGEVMVGHRTVLWGVRIVLLFAFLLHIITVIQLYLRNKKAREVPYQSSLRRDASTFASRTMIFSGAVLFLFVVYHLCHLTFGTLHFHGFEEGKVYSNVYNAFIHPLPTIIYLVALVFVSFHLYHGIWSIFQSLGLNTERCNDSYRKIAIVLAFLITAGFASVPLAVFLRALPPP
ncbi:MAG: succinate dehydrogenase [Candidatus Dadabacteria bacterium]|nr:MAG: succinate dehydrogenase [Candidatus Dadabacteria bacterium]